MKTKALLAILVSFYFHTYSQNKDSKFNLNIGGGFNNYNGDLGNTFFKLDEEAYGFAKIGVSYYINPSFDVNLNFTYGEIGHCRESDEPQFREDGTEVLNMCTSLASSVISVSYKFNNGYIFKQDSRISPYVFVGIGINSMVTPKYYNYTRVNAGKYGSANFGGGLKYNITSKFNFGYNMGFGSLFNDNMDFVNTGKNDIYMQNTFQLGYNLF